jgi:hypothetical protein
LSYLLNTDIKSQFVLSLSLSPSQIKYYLNTLNDAI